MIGKTRCTSRRTPLASTFARDHSVAAFQFGLTQAQVAARLFVSENTANWHRRNIYRKLGVHRRSEAVARGVELGLIAPGSQG